MYFVLLQKTSYHFVKFYIDLACENVKFCFLPQFSVSTVNTDNITVNHKL